ncbi:MAG: hypothetical protein ACRDQW_05525 [Haloechinothrix sp.]
MRKPRLPGQGRADRALDLVAPLRGIVTSQARARCVEQRRDRYRRDQPEETGKA